MKKDQNRRIVVTDATNERTVCSSGLMADTFSLRLFGLLGKKGIDEEAGLLIKPSSGVHTFGMSFPIDIVSLDKKNCVTGTWENIGPWKVCGMSLKTHSVLELAAGKIARCGIGVGDQLVIEAME